MNAKKVRRGHFGGSVLAAPLLFLLFGSVSSALAQSADADTEIWETAQSWDYRLGARDLISVQIFGLDGDEQMIRVSNSGRIHVANVGVLTVSGLTVSQVEEEIGRQLRERDMVKDPWVRVRVAEYNSQPVYAIGEFNMPGQFLITGEMRLLDLVSRAGGFSPGAATEGILIRRQYLPWIEVSVDFAAASISEMALQMQTSAPAEGAGEEAVDRQRDAAQQGERILINLEDLRRGVRPDLNVPLRGGDVFMIPRRHREYIYIVGEVIFPGAYGLPQYYDHLTAARVIAFAGGPLRTAKTSKAFIMRRDSAGEVIGVPFDFRDILEGKEQDLPIQAGDIIYVPRSVPKTIGFRMLDLVAHLSQQFIIF